MKALVTGASGFVGGHLVGQLAREGHTVLSLVRKTSRVETLQSITTELAYGDVRDKVSLERIFEQHPDIDTVFHLASLLTPISVTDQVYWDINYQGTQHLLDVCREAKLKAFVHCSSVGVIGPLPEIPADETSRCAPDSNYGESKYKAELLALEYQKSFGLPVTVIRPAWAYGPGDRRTVKFFRMVAKGHFFLIGDGQTRLSPVYVTDIARGMILGAEKIEQAGGEVFIVSGGTTVTLHDLASAIAREANTRVLPFKIPAGLARMGATICETLCKPLHIEPPIHHRRLDFFFREQAFDISKIQTRLGFTPAVDLATGVRQTVTWYKEQGWLA